MLVGKIRETFSQDSFAAPMTPENEDKLCRSR
jgi:hypothetical protein